MSSGIFRLDFQRPFKTGQRFAATVKVLQRMALVIVRGCIVRRQLQGMFTTDQRIFMPRQALQQHGAIGQRRGIARPELNTGLKLTNASSMRLRSASTRPRLSFASAWSGAACSARS
jgi:hypothetical protein